MIGSRAVIETYRNGTSWYYVCNDGWCEQGGVGTENTTINLLKQYADTDYSLLLSYAYLISEDYSISPRTKTVSSFEFAIHGDTTGDGLAYWRTSGWIK